VKIDDDKVVYKLTVENLQIVAKEEIGRTLTDDEVGVLENVLGDYIAWYDSINAAIQEHIGQ